MKSKRKLWIISFCCIGAGIVLLSAGLTMDGRLGFYINNTGIHSARENDSQKPRVQEKMKLDPFTSIEIDINYADLKILPSDGYYIEYQLNGGSPEPVLELKDQKLRFQEGASGGNVGFNFVSFGGFSSEHYSYYVNLYVPSDQYFTFVKLKNDDGSMDIGSISSKSMEIRDDYGDVRMEEFKGGKLKADMGNGSFRAEHLKADDFSISNDYGDCNIGTAQVKHLEAELGNGNFTMDRGHGASIDVVNQYGMVKLGLAEPFTAYKLDLETEYGSIKAPGFPGTSIGEDDTRSFKYTDKGTNQIKVRCDNGDIVIDVR